ncbi:MAG: hypothetical protein K0Q66_640 [Chitinophagaceae bacterium]|nr:hypothetical protein [Chitinophagaceae bacterium]
MNANVDGMHTFMKVPLLIIFCFGVFNSFAHAKGKTPPSIQLYGKLEAWNYSPVVYYSMNGDPFTAKRSFRVDTGMNYRFDLSKSVYKKQKTGFIYFAIDTTSDSKSTYGCYHRVSVDSIYAWLKQSRKTRIEIHTDLPVGFNCEGSKWYEAEGPDAGFVGNYSMQSKDTTYDIKLNAALYIYDGFLSPAGPTGTGTEWGSWKYFLETKTLRIFVVYRRNRDAGIILSADWTREFKVVEGTYGRKLVSNDGSVLTRLTP